MEVYMDSGCLQRSVVKIELCPWLSTYLHQYLVWFEPSAYSKACWLFQMPKAGTYASTIVENWPPCLCFGVDITVLLCW